MSLQPGPADPAASERRAPRSPRRTCVSAAIVAGALIAATVVGIAAASAAEDRPRASGPAAPLPGGPPRSGWILGTVTTPQPGRFVISKSNGQAVLITTAPATRYYRQTRTTITPTMVGQYLLARGDPQRDGSFDAGVIGLSRPNHGCSPAEAFGATITMITDSANLIAGPITAVHGSRLRVRTRDGLRQVQTAYASSITTSTAASASAVSPGSVVMVATNRSGGADTVYVGALAGLPGPN